MTFAWPHLLWLLLVPTLLFAWDFTRRRRSASSAHPKILQAEAGTQHLSLVTRHSPVARARPWLFLGLMCAIVAFARPQWGRLEEPVFDQSREILLAIDLSRSMLTPDVRPSRLERAKLLTQSLLEKLAGERVGLIVFSGTAFLQSPLSSDYEILREFLPVLGPNYMPEGGTNYGALIDTALGAFGTSTAADRFLVILSDGEATDDNWHDRVDELKKKGIRVISLGVGTATGAMIPDGSGGLVKDERGAVVLSKLESATLRQLADLTNGTYRDASTWLDLASVLNATVEAGRKGKFLEKNTVRLVERYQWPLGFALWFLLVSFYYEFPVRPRPRDLRLAPDSAKRTVPASTLAAASLLLLVALILPSTLSATASPPAAPPLSKIVGRLSAQPSSTARDWAELSNETVLWGQKIQSEQQPVPPGPVQDALAAVDLGSAQNPKATDWAKLRRDLEALLQKPEDQKRDEQKQNQNQDQKNQDQQNQDQSKQDSQKNQQQQQDQSKQQQSQQQQSKSDKQQEQQKKESAFGDMKDHEQKPPPPKPQPGETQKVGGVPEKKDSEKNSADPAMALPLQKLDQLRNQDSPAELFQLMDADKKTGAPVKPKKDW